MAQYCTFEELEKLKKELDYLKTVKTKEIAELIRHTASHGDLKENAAYQEAKERQAFLHGRILELEENIRNAEVIEKKQSDKVQIGSVVLVSLNGKEEKFYIVGSGQIDSLQGKISYESPLGKALLGKTEGATVKINIQGEKITSKILKVD